MNEKKNFKKEATHAVILKFPLIDPKCCSENCPGWGSIVWGLEQSSEQDKPCHGKGTGNVEPFGVILTI